MSDATTSLVKVAPSRILVIGGGFAGRKLIRCLCAYYTVPIMDITLVDAKSFFEFTPSALRCIVQPANARTCVIPQQVPAGSKTKCKLVTGTVVSVGINEAFEGEATLGDGRVIPFDAAVLAMGSNYAAPIKPDMTTRASVAERIAQYEHAHAHLSNAHDVVVVGGGTVGVEMAAEVAGHWTGRQAKRVTLITASERLLNRMPARASRLATAWLEKYGVCVITNARVRDAAGGGRAIRDGAVTLDDGRRIKADIVYTCLGAPPCTSNFTIRGVTVGSPIAVADTGQVLDDKHKPIPNLFAAGDVCSSAGEKNALNADLNAALCARNVQRTLFNGGALARWPADICHGSRKSPDVVVVSLYKWCAIMQVNSIVFSGLLPALMKVVIEFMQIRTAKEDIVITYLWSVAEALTIFVASYIP